jgi:hypothetical protein
MQDGSFEFPCRIDFQALLAFGRLVGVDSQIEVFVAYRDQIERATSSKYDRTERCDYEIVTVAADDFQACRAEQRERT